MIFAENSWMKLPSKVNLVGLFLAPTLLKKCL